MERSTSIEPVALSQALIRCPSVTPRDEGALDTLQEALQSLGFRCLRKVFSEAGTADVDNLYARIGEGGRNFCFAGHTDVVPVGDAAAWSVDPFAAEVRDGRLIGRGAADMKAAIACFVAAVGAFLGRCGSGFDGRISLLITGDEEAVSVNGTCKLLPWVIEQGERLDACLVGEPTSEARLGDMIKIGRRGAMNGRISAFGTQGHAAYAQFADNPVHRLVAMLAALLEEPMDAGSDHFEPTSLQITSVDVGNSATNVIPAVAHAVFDCRFSDRQTSQTVLAWMRERLDRAGGRYRIEPRVSGESFLTPPGPLSDVVAAAVRETLAVEPALGTTGGTSDARFIKDHCPHVELGMRNATAHKVDEWVAVDEVRALARVYEAVLNGYFADRRC
jgi:succinyl-diaminopimelate desuccinylase